MESVFSLDPFSAIAANLHYVRLLGQPLPEFLCTAWHISSQPAPSVPVKTMSNSGLLSSYSGRIAALQLNSGPLHITPVPDAHILFR